MSNSTKIRLGQINFTNVWPVFHYFPFAQFEPWLENVEMVPTGLNRAISNGEIDLAPISSFAYAEQFERLLLLPNLSVSCENQVHSILLFHKVPLEQLNGKQVSLTNASATSVNLLKIILDKFIGVRPIYISESPELTEMLRHSDAALLIGDDAIRASWEQSNYYITDLAELWKKYTGFGMTFAVWAVRIKIIQDNPEKMLQIYEAFIESKRKGLSDLEPIIDRAQAQLGGTHGYWKQYFTALNYDFNHTQQRGLELYYQYAYELGLLTKPVHIRYWPTTLEN